MSSNDFIQNATIRRMDPTRDLNAVANLMEAAFELKKDPEGHVIIENMRQHARMIAANDATLLDKLTVKASWSDGFVFEDQNKIVGNITLIPHMDGFKRVIMIANVSVDDAYRRRGIARALTLQALQRCRMTGVREVYLQVRHDNQAAIQLYLDLGFRHLHSVNVWRLRQSASGLDQLGLNAHALEDGYTLRYRRFGDWQKHKVWLAECYPQKTRWYSGLAFRQLSPLCWLNPLAWLQLMQMEHFALSRDGELVGVLGLQSHAPQVDMLWLALPEDLDAAEENKRAALLLRTFVRERWNHGKVNLEFPMGRATAGIQEAGFKLAHDLDWMALRL